MTHLGNMFVIGTLAILAWVSVYALVGFAWKIAMGMYVRFAI